MGSWTACTSFPKELIPERYPHDYLDRRKEPTSFFEGMHQSCRMIFCCSRMHSVADCSNANVFQNMMLCIGLSGNSCDVKAWSCSRRDTGKKAGARKQLLGNIQGAALGQNAHFTQILGYQTRVMNCSAKMQTGKVFFVSNVRTCLLVLTGPLAALPR
jgi:hypothetical protein